jgi:mono/diheme cytochrome c family protein
MKTTFTKILALTSGSLLAIVISATCIHAASAEPAAGEKVFMASNCNACHSIDSLSIKKKLGSSKAPDLSNIGSEKTAEWITDWLNRKEKLHDKTHVKQWTGKPEDLKTLVDWLVTLKTEKKSE